MLTQLIEGLDGLLALPQILRFLLWVEVTQTVLLFCLVLALIARKEKP